MPGGSPLERSGKRHATGGHDRKRIALDITDIPVMQDQIATAGPFDILVNSAGGPACPALETTQDDFDAVTGVNLKSAYFLAQAVATGLIAAGKPGSLITISSQMALVGGLTAQSMPRQNMRRGIHQIYGHRMGATKYSG